MKTQNTSFNWAFALFVFLALGIGAYALILYGDLTGIKSQPFVTEKGTLPEVWTYVLWVHALSAGVALSIGWLQFVKQIRYRLLSFHRAIGLLYSLLMIIAAITGFYLALYASGGWIAKLGFSTLSLLWLYTLARGLKSIISDNDPLAHGEWMLRNYALTAAAITLRVYTGLASAFLGLSDTNGTFFVIAWLAWVPNLIYVQWLIVRRRKSIKA